MFRKIIAMLLIACVLASGLALAAETSADSSEGLVPFKNDNKKWGYKDAAGNVVIKPQFTSANDFHNGLAKVQISKSGYALDEYIDSKGKVVIKPMKTKSNYYSYNDWQGDYATVFVWRINKNGSIDPIAVNYIMPNGKLLLDEDVLYTGYFFEGYALVGAGKVGQKLSMSGMQGESSYVGQWKGNDMIIPATEYYFIDMEGNRLDGNVWASARKFQNGYAPVAVKGADGSLLWGLIDITGKLVVAPAWTSISTYANGFACVQDGEKYGFVDETGSLAIPCEYDMAYGFSEDGLAAVKVGDKYGYINASGEMVIEPAYNSARTFSNGCAVVKDGVAYGVIDVEGNAVIPACYESIYAIPGTGYFDAKEFSTPLIVNQDGAMKTILLLDGELPTEEQAAGYPDGTECRFIAFPGDNIPEGFGTFVDEGGKVISMNTFVDEGDTYHIAAGSGLHVILNAQGQPVGDAKWEGVKVDACTADRICVLQRNLYGFADADGNLVIQPQYTDASRFVDGVATVWMGQNSMLIDENGREVIVLPTLSKGSKGDDVKKLQEALIEQGYLAKAEKNYGNKTVEAVKAAQGDFGMEQTGEADNAFQHRLYGE